ncbi:sensor histidine kinase [Acetoanaerobium noterae]|uniref:sensor histidine kinase n=1 Tax=Acetoanaerobium noterae TaxID=745369 RepID=UPI0033406914
MQNNVTFRASTNIKSLVGKDLVTDKYAAIYELVKNSYDADATEIHLIFENVDDQIQLVSNSKLTIIDNGLGMSVDDLVNKWMVIGTNSKQVDNNSEIYNRVYSGDKGIGRFSTDRLGRRLRLYSKCPLKNVKFDISFDWSKFEKYQDNISNINLPYTHEEYSGIEKGVILEITSLRDKWSKKEIENLIENLRHLKNPFDFETEFNIYITAKDYAIVKRKIEKYNFSDMSTLKLEGKVIGDKLTLEISNADGVHHETHISNYSFGDIKYTIYYFDQGAKRRFRSKMKQAVKDYGDIQVYYDNFKVHPYGNVGNDWLNIDKRSMQKLFGKFFSTIDLIGYVNLSKLRNPGIRAATDRQGLIESDELNQLRDCLITFGVGILEKYHYNILVEDTNNRYKETRNKIESTSNNLKGIAEDLLYREPEVAKKLKRIAREVDQVKKEQIKYEKNKDQEIKVYKRNAQSSVLLHSVIHNALIKLKNSNSTITRIKRKFSSEMSPDLIKQIELLDTQVSDAKGYLLSAKDQLIGKREKVEIKVKSFISDIIEYYRNENSNSDIEFQFDANDDLYCLIDPRDLRTIMDNLLSNSIKSVHKSNRTTKSVKISSYKTSKATYIRVRDNGIGVPESLRDRIFDPFFTTTQGFGMGLSIIDEVVKSYNGSLHLSSDDVEHYTEFIVKIGG